MYEYGGSAEITAINPGAQDFNARSPQEDRRSFKNSPIRSSTNLNLPEGVAADEVPREVPILRTQSVYDHIPYWQRITLVEDLTFLYGDPQLEAGTMSNRSKEVHGDIGNSKLPIVAPPVANENDESIFTVRSEDGLVIQGGLLEMLPESEPTLWTPDEEYPISSTVFLQKDGISYYFVAKKAVPRNVIPPNKAYWIQDECSKTLRGCSFRWSRPYLTSLGMGHLIGDKMGNLPFGGFPAVNK
jgi:hypothetical protein